MKNKIRLLFILIMVLVIPKSVFAASQTYNDTVKIVQEVMKDYYIRGPYIQYHNSRRTTDSPEEATSQDIHYTVCSGYVYDVYNEAFKMTDLPVSTDLLIKAARDYYNTNKNNSSKLNGNFLLYYENTTSGNKAKYAYNNKTKFSDFVNLIQPGDIFVFSGHAMIAYGVYNVNGRKDVLLLNANARSKDEIMSRITYGTRELSFSYSPVEKKNNIIDVDIEGGIQYKWLSDFSSRFVETYLYDKNEDTSTHGSTYLNCNKKQLRYYKWNSSSNKYVASAPTCTSNSGYIGSKTPNNYWVDCNTLTFYQMTSSNSNKEIGKCSNLTNSNYNKDLMCQMDECIVIRPFYKNNNNVSFNYAIDDKQYNKSKERLTYPGLLVEKTSSKGDYNSVYPNDVIEYTIKITNKSSVASGGKTNYGSFVIEETLDSNVEYLSSTNNGTRSNNIIKWNITSLNADSKIELKYKVKVKNNIGKTIVAKGILYNPSNSSKKNDLSVTTGNIKNYIIKNVSNPKTSYETCFNNNKESKKGLELIDAIYNCSRDKNFSFTTFDFEKIFSKKATETNQIYLKNNPDSQHKLFQDMILNDYWGGIAIYRNSGNQIVPLAFRSSSRKRSFNDTDFQNGDILIYFMDYDKGVYNPYDTKNRVANKTKYTNEKGMYAFIYLNGKFVGVNGSGTTARNEFTYQYYSGNNLNTNLYGNISSLGANKDYYLKIINYETLLDKDYYIILRPEKVIAEQGSSNSIKGDVNGNGKIDTKDYILIRKHLLSISKLTGDELKRADVNGDGKVSSADYITIRKLILKL